MKRSLRTLILCFVAGVSMAAVADDASTTSYAGHVFKKVTNHPELGNAWSDEGGLIWGDMVQANQLSSQQASTYCANRSDTGACLMTQAQAVAYCQSIKASLPTKEQFIQLDKYIGDSFTTLDINWNFLVPKEQVEVIPNLFGPDVIFETADQDPIDNVPADTLTFIFQYGTDAALQIHDSDILNDYPNSSEKVRCVVR